MKKGVDYIGVAVCFACHDGNGKFLFAKRGPKARDEQGKWEVPAGGIEVGETIDVALRRELKEELCVENPKNVEYIGYEEYVKPVDGVMKHWITFSFMVELDPADVRIGEPEVCDELTWCAITEPPQPMHSATPDTIALVEKYLARK